MDTEIENSYRRYSKANLNYQTAKAWNVAGLTDAERITQDVAYKKLEIAAWDAYKEYNQLVENRARAS